MSYFAWTAWLALVAAAPLLAASQPASEAQRLHGQAAARIDRFVEHFQRTGDRATLKPELQQAEQELAASHQLFVAGGDAASAALSLVKLGDALRLQEQWDAAIARYQDARRAAEQAGHRLHEARASLGLAKALLYSKRLEAAGTPATEAARLSELAGDKPSLVDALLLIGQVQVARGDPIAAADMFTRALTLAEQLDDQKLLLFAYMDRADAFLQRALRCDYENTFDLCYQDLDRAKADYEQAHRRALALGYRGQGNLITSFMNDVEERRTLIEKRAESVGAVAKLELFHPKKPGDVLVTERFYTKPEAPAALLQQLAAEFPGDDARSFFIRGHLRALGGDEDEALRLLLGAVERLERDRGQLRDETARAAFLQDKITFYYYPIRHLLQRRRTAEAFDLLERSRSRAMADLLASRDLAFSRPADRVLYAETMKLQSEIAALQKDLFELRTRRASADRPDSGPSSSKAQADAVARIEAQIRTREDARRTLLARAEKDAPRFRELLVAAPVTLAALQRSAGEHGYELLYYLVEDEGILLWHIGPDAVHVRNVFLPRRNLTAAVARLRTSLTDRETDPDARFDEDTARELFLFLIAPALQWMRTDRLVIVPHEDLHYVPFQALQDPSSGEYLGERFRISYAPSATVLVGLEPIPNIAGGSLFASADPDIVDAAVEVETISKFYPGRSRVLTDRLIAESDLKTSAAGFDLVHLAVHGEFNPREPLLSHLKLGASDRDDGVLTAAEMFGLPFGDARLVVLSACETGQAEATHSNEIVGMVRALLYAGAQAVVLSSWKVDAAATAAWMETFYREAQTRPVPDAAHAALLAVKRRPEYRHPYFWAPFLVVAP